MLKRKSDISNFDYALKLTLWHEGGLSLDKKDPGGGSNFGISLRYLQNSASDINGDGIIDQEDLRALDKDTAAQIYYDEFWQKNRYGEINDKILAAKIFDLAVNAGAYQANKILQRAVNNIMIPKIKVDGVVGSETLQSVNYIIKTGENDRLFNALVKKADVFYTEIIKKNPKLNRFKRGWLNRLYS